MKCEENKAGIVGAKKYQTCFMTVDDIPVCVIWKPIKWLRIKIQPPDGKVRVSVPLGVGESEVRRAVLSKITWIRKHRIAMVTQWEQSPLHCVDGARLRFQGRDCVLMVIHRTGRGCFARRNGERIELFVTPGSSEQLRCKALESWFRQELASAILALSEKWERILGVSVSEWRIKRMKTRWGTCNVQAKRIWINLELIRHSGHLLELIIVHELAHLLEASHNRRFNAIMDRNLPDWRYRRKLLNNVPRWL